MWKKATIGGVAAVAVLAGGAGMAIAHAEGVSSPAAAAAATATPTGSATGSATTAAPGATKTKGAGKGAGKTKTGDGSSAKAVLGALKDLQHGEWVTKSGSNAAVTHDAILGSVQAVSASSITVASADGTSMTFAVTDQTAVGQHQKKGATASPTKPTIADVKTGQTVMVAGTKAPDLTAQHVLVRAG